MPVFPGECDRCGGPQYWTEVDGIVWVACQAGCLDAQGDLFGVSPPMIALGPEPEEEMEPLERERVAPPEGGAADETDSSVLVHIGVPLEAVLLHLWEGGWDGPR